MAFRSFRNTCRCGLICVGEVLPAYYDDGGFSGGNLERPVFSRVRCERMIDVTQGGDDVAVWRVSCDGARVYWTGVGNDGDIVSSRQRPGGRRAEPGRFAPAPRSFDLRKGRAIEAA